MLHRNAKARAARTRKARKLGFESLAARLVLSASPTQLDGPQGENDDHIVQQQNEIVFVIGSDANDTIEVEMGITQHLLTINGEDHQYDANQVNQIVVSGMGGNDKVDILGSDLDDRVEVDADELEMLNARYAVRVRSAETVSVVGGAGFDTVKFFDSAGNDEVFMHSDFTTLTNEQGDTFTASEFERNEAFSENGGRDKVNFHDSEQDDRFVAKEGFSYMVGSNFWNYAKGFKEVDAFYSNGGADEARLYDSIRDDRIVARPDEVIFSVGDVVLSSHDFPVTRAYATQGYDTAELHGQQFVRDLFVWETTSSFMYTSGEFDFPPFGLGDIAVTPITAANVVVGFDLVQAHGQDNADRAELRGSAGNDDYIALPEIVQLTTPGAEVTAADFRIVRTFGRGGDDTAYLEDSEFNDRYTSNEFFAYMEGRDYLNYVSGFVINAVARNGGFDFANPQGYHGPDGDYLIFDGPQFFVYGPERQERIRGFEEGRGDGINAGWQVLNPIENDFTLGGSHDQNDSPDEFQFREIRDWSAEVIPVYEVVDGKIVEANS